MQDCIFLPIMCTDMVGSEIHTYWVEGFHLPYSNCTCSTGCSRPVASMMLTL